MTGRMASPELNLDDCLCAMFFPYHIEESVSEQERALRSLEHLSFCKD